MRAKVGVLALQGAFIEHEHVLRRIDPELTVVEIRTVADLSTPDLDGLILPGGESTTMGLIAERSGLLEPLRQWVRLGRPVWGVCAGLIMIAKEATRAKRDGQALLGSLDVTVERNHFGTQLQSFQQELEVSLPSMKERPFFAVFIRAPVVTRLGEGVEPIAFVREGENKVVVGVRQGRTIGTAFHPELTHDDRFHRYFLELVDEYKKSVVA